MSRSRAGDLYLSQTLKDLNLRRIIIEGDGNCQFRAIADQLRKICGRHEEDHVSVRHAIVASMRSNKDVYERFLDEPFELYLDKMAQQGEWGDQVTLKAASSVYDVTIQVYTSNGEGYGERHESETGSASMNPPVLTLLHVNGNHFDSTEQMDVVESQKTRIHKRKREKSDNTYDDDDDDIGDDDDQEQQQQHGEQGCPREPSTRFIPPTKKSGKLYTSIPLVVFDGRADPEEKVMVVTQTGRSAGLWTMRPEGDGIFRLFPLLEGASSGTDYISTLKPPYRVSTKKGTSLQGHGSPVLHVNLDILNHTITGPSNSTVSIPLLKGISKRSKKDKGEIDRVLGLVASCEDQVIKKLHDVLATTPDPEGKQSPLDTSDRTLAEAANRFIDRMLETDFEEDAEEETADLERRTRKRMDEDTIGWGYRKTLHEGGRRLLLYSLLSSFSEHSKKSIEKFIPASDEGEARSTPITVKDVCESPWDHPKILKQLFQDDAGSAGDMEIAIRSMCHESSVESDDRCRRILKSIDEHALTLGIKSSALMGEAFEIFSAFSFKQKGTADLRDYIEERRSQGNGSSLFVACKVHHCYISGSPRESPFRLSEEDLAEIHTHLKESTSNDPEAFTKVLWDHMKRDRGYDVLVWLKEVCQSSGTTGRSHFLLLQCKARSNREAKVDSSKYISLTYDLQLRATDVGCLAPLVWCSNVSYNRSFSNRHQMSVSRGHIIPWLLPDICGDGDAHDLVRRVGLAAVNMGTSWARTRVEDSLPPKLRPHQTAAVAELRDARRREIRCGVANKATGSGKTFTACEDALRAEEENPVIRALASLCMAPGIDLLLQVASEWWSWERRRKRGGGCPAPADAEDAERDAWEKAGAVACRLFYYVVCSASESEVASAHLRVISVSELRGTLGRHMREGTLHLCRFFTTIEGGGSFWYEARRFNLLHGNEPTDPVFGVFVRDEVHKMCGVNSSPYSLGLNVPAHWMPSYTATPITEESRTELIRRTMRRGKRASLPDDKKEEKKSSSAGSTENPVLVPLYDDDDDEEEEEEEEELQLEEELEHQQQQEEEEEEEHSGDDTVEVMQTPSRRRQRMENTSAQDLFPQVHLPGMADGLSDPALDKAVQGHGLHGLQLLPRSMLFQDLEQVASRNPSFAQILEGIRDVGSYATTANFHAQLENRLKMSVAIFQVVPSANGQDGMYDVDFCFSRRNVKMLHMPKQIVTMESMDRSCVVLGLHDPKEQAAFSCVEFTSVVRPMGAVVHDCTSFSPESNLIGPILSRFSFAECFASKSLATPALALSDRGLLRVSPGLVTDQVKGLLQSWAGVKESTQDTGTGLSIEDPRKVFFSVHDVGPERNHSVTASAHDFHCMNHLLDLFVCNIEEHGVKPITKAIVFCPSSKIARRCMAVFRALAHLRQERQDDRAGVYGSIVSGHVFESDKSAPDLRQHYEVRQKIIWRFRGAERAVLFNVDLLSTGVNLPCCDCVYLQCPSRNTNVVLQRWGRALRRTTDPDKVGLLAMPCTDPYEPDEDQREEWRRIGLEQDEVFEDRSGQFYSKFDLTCRLVECAVDPRNLILGQLISVVTGSIHDCEKDAQGKRKSKKLESFLNLMISRRGDSKHSVTHLSNADLLLLQKCTRVIGVNLLNPWFFMVQDILEWYRDHGDAWPRSIIYEVPGVSLARDKMTPEQEEEVKLGNFLSKLRCGRAALMNNETQLSKLKGMTQARLQYINDTLPDGWEHPNAGDEEWKARIRDVLAWYMQHGENWPRSAIKIKNSRKALTRRQMTFEQQKETSLGCILVKARKGRDLLNDGETNKKKLQGMTQDRLKYLNDTLPQGWADATAGDKAWRASVREVLKWYEKHGKNWPRHAIYNRETGKYLNAIKMTPDQKEETRLGGILKSQRSGRIQLLNVGKDGKNGMTHARLKFLNDTFPEGWENGRNNKRSRR